jgi:hypothetical protein
MCAGAKPASWGRCYWWSGASRLSSPHLGVTRQSISFERGGLTCNPDADSWVAEYLAWWIDQETGLPIPERAGILRHFIPVSEKVVWADRPEGLMQQMKLPQDLPPAADPPRPISVTFIPAKVFDNPPLLRVNPEYPAWLLSLPLLERERLLGGNWKIRPAAGLYFRREWCSVADQAPADLDVVHSAYSHSATLRLYQEEPFRIRA